MGYENINIIRDATGASKQTASQDGLQCKGVPASEKMAETDLDDMKTYKKIIKEVGAEFKIDPALIAAIISRESRAGKVLHDGWGDWNPVRQAYNAWGLMQVDVNPNGGGHKPVPYSWNSIEHLRQATGILVYFIGRIRKKFGNWTEAQQLKGGIAAYNMGDGNVHSYENVDANTTGSDYSNDVVARARWYRIHLFGQ